MAANHAKHWTAIRSKRRVAPFWEVRNTRGVVLVCYGTKGDAELAAAAPRLCSELKHPIAIVRLREGDLRASEKAAVDRAQALINELNN